MDTSGDVTLNSVCCAEEEFGIALGGTGVIGEDVIICGFFEKNQSIAMAELLGQRDLVNTTKTHF